MTTTGQPHDAGVRAREGDGTSDSGVDDSGGTAGSLDQGYLLTRVLEGASWKAGQRAVGFTVDAAEVVYVADGSGVVYAVDGDEISEYMSVGDGTLAVDIEWDLPSGQLYLLDRQGVMTSSAPHRWEVVHEFENFGSSLLGVVNTNVQLVVSRSGLTSFAESGDVVLYPEERLGTGCANEGMAVQSSGTFLYNPGCNGSPFLIGDIGGSGLRTLFGGFDTPELQAARCVASVPGGGFVQIVEYDGELRLVRYAEDATETSGFEFLVTSPSIEQARGRDSFLLSFCELAVAPSGTIFILSWGQLWKATPL